MAELKQLDLGAGGADRIRGGYEGYGVDIVDVQRPWLKDNRVCDLALDRIPYDNDTFDLITAHDLLEHIQPVLYLPQSVLAYPDNEQRQRKGWAGHVEKRNCMIELFNEIYRVLKPGGIFYHQTPGYHPESNLQAIWSDPTHCFVWTPDTKNHFSGDYYGQHDDYGHRSKFVCLSSRFENGHFIEEYQTIKPNEPPYEVKI